MASDSLLRILLFAACLRLYQARILLFWAVDGSKRTQDMVKRNVRHVELSGIPHDVILAHYRGSDKDWDREWCKKHVSESLVAKGYKFHLMQKAYKDGQWEDRYEFIWALDSDIDLSKADIQHFLTMARLSQSPIVGPTFVQANGKPLLFQEHSTVVRREGHAPSRDSHRHAHQISGPNAIQTPDPGCDFRHTDFVELTAPLLKSHVLKLVLRDCHSCIHDKSDWGLDMMWCKYASKRLQNQACALIDATPVIHMDWGLAPISQEFYRALHAVQTTYNAYWSDRRVLDCKRRGEGLVEIPEEDAAQTKARNTTSSKKRSAKAANSTRQKAGKSDSRKDHQDDTADEPAEEEQDDDGLPSDSEPNDAKSSDSADNPDEEGAAGDGEEEEEADGAPSSDKTAQQSRMGNTSKQAAKKERASDAHSSSAGTSRASKADAGKRADAEGSDEETQEEDAGLDGGLPADKSKEDPDEEGAAGDGEEEEEADDAPSSDKTAQQSRMGNTSKQAAKKERASDAHSSSAGTSRASKADGGKRADAEGSDEDADVPDLDTTGNASHPKAEDKPARRSMPGGGIFKVKATQNPSGSLDDGVLPSGSRLSMGESAPAAASAVENTTHSRQDRAIASTKTKPGSTNSETGAVKGDSTGYEDMSLGDEEDLDLDFPAESGAQNMEHDAPMEEPGDVSKSPQDLAGSTKKKTLDADVAMAEQGGQGQDSTVEFQEVSQRHAIPDPVRADASAFQEAEQRLRDDIESLRKLEQELRLRSPPGPVQSTRSQIAGQKPAKAAGRATPKSSKRRKGPAAASQQAMSLLELGSAPASEEELQALEIQQLAAGQREVAMKAAQEVVDNMGSSLTADERDRTRRAAIESVRHAVAEQVEAQERQQNIKAAGAMSELLRSAQSDHEDKAELSMVRQLKAELAEAKELADKDHQVEEQKVSTLLERLAHQRSEPARANEDKLLIARAKQILELKAQVQWDEKRLSKEKEDELVLKNKIRQLEEKIRQRRHASLHEAKNAKRAKARKVAVDVDHSGRALPIEQDDR
ncbi:ACP5 [Symbiodinium natans]|uniref:ACP5 protein n=1 Tax=Symbiodinium natans TaxID=878477 RepID=A0A812HMC3_9DINO|nr:ACP5 [Symbiodinium natans]